MNPLASQQLHEDVEGGFLHAEVGIAAAEEDRAAHGGVEVSACGKREPVGSMLLGVDARLSVLK